MRATKNSKASRSSKPPRAATAGGLLAPAITFILLLALGAGAAAWVNAQGYTLDFGDAESHLNTARKILDSRTPGYEQIGTAWLPVIHVVMMPFVSNDELWRTGLAAVFPGVLSFALGGLALFAAVRRIFASTPAAACATALYALNPNLLYLQSTPMNEPIFLAALLGLLYFSLLAGSTGSVWAVAAAGLCSITASLTRYDGWFVIPFVCLYLLLTGGARRWTLAIVFGAIASAAPLYWMAHNYWYYSNALEFYNGPYSAKAIQGGKPYPGQHDWTTAIRYYSAAASLCVGVPLLFLGAVGSLIALWKRAWWGVVLLVLSPVFYVLSLYSSGPPIFVPHLWPHSYYNTRYGIGMLPLLALAAAALVVVMPERFRRVAAIAIVLIGIAPWVAFPRPDSWIVWKEGQVNGRARRAWTAEAGAFMRAHYRPGDGILFSFSDVAGILRHAGIPFREGLHEGNGPHALATIMRPDLFMREKWAIAISSDDVAGAMWKLARTSSEYERVKIVHVKDAPLIEIWRRSVPLDGHSIHKSARRQE